MIADDDDQMRAVMRRYLDRAGSFEIVEAVNGPEAVLVAEDETPAVVILDYMMPGMTGEEIAKEIHDRVPEVKVIACSSVVVSQPYWADAYIDKSNLSEVAAIVADVLGSVEPTRVE